MRGTILAAIALLCALGACRESNPASGKPYPVSVNGDPVRGRKIIVDVGCGSCHVIPGIREANGLVGPPLMWWARRTYIAGELANTPDNLVRWVRFPRSIEAGTAMPAMGLTEQQATDIAAYLYTLR